MRCNNLYERGKGHTEIDPVMKLRTLAKELTVISKGNINTFIHISVSSRSMWKLLIFKSYVKNCSCEGEIGRSNNGHYFK